MPDDELDLLSTAELWEAGPRGHDECSRPLFVAGWEDADPFCAGVCTNDVGLAFCRRCPQPIVGSVLSTGRPAHGRCPAGVGLLAFPSPIWSRRQVAVLRVGRPAPAEAAAISGTVRVSPAILRRAAQSASDPTAATVRAAARSLRHPESLTHWRVRTREMAAVRRRSTSAALAQMLVTGDEYYELYLASLRQLRDLERRQRRIDLLARDATRELEIGRAEVAHRLHDTAAQTMVGAFRHLEAAMAYAPPEPRLREQLDLASRRLSEAVADTRALVRGLTPPGLEELGLRAALEIRVHALLAERRAGIRERQDDGDGLAPETAVSEDVVEVRYEGTMPRLEGWVERAVYGITVEAVTNAVRHAGARAVTVRFGVRGSRCVVEIIDDGHGFDAGLAERRAREGHLGLLGISRQARWLGGTATVRSRAHAGTRVRISIPLQGVKAAAIRAGSGSPGGKGGGNPGAGSDQSTTVRGRAMPAVTRGGGG